MVLAASVFVRTKKKKSEFLAMKLAIALLDTADIFTLTSERNVI